MLVRQPQYRSHTLYAPPPVVGLCLEAAVFFVGNYWARRYSPDAPTLGPLLLLLAGAGLYLSAQILHLVYSIPHVAGASLSLLAAMLAWVGLVLVAVWIALSISLALAALVVVPFRLAAAGLRATSAPRPAR
ncbi:MAG: hypothetical protein FJ109_11445 [Deltaproteobacteria bacterium]|nr:hypothetical protein [Deltaproteobacteria bacterium]